MAITHVCTALATAVTTGWGMTNYIVVCVRTVYVQHNARSRTALGQQHHLTRNWCTVALTIPTRYEYASTRVIFTGKT